MVIKVTDKSIYRKVTMNNEEDVLVFQFQDRLTTARMEEILKSIQSCLNDKKKTIMVLDNGCKLIHIKGAKKCHS